MLFEITNEEFEELMLYTIEPVLLALLLVAFATFTISSYKKGELRLYSSVLLLIAIAIMFAMVGNYLLEGILLITASISFVVSSIVLRSKSVKMEV